MINISGSYKFETARDEIWPLLFDVDTLMDLIPGCYSLEKIGEDEFQGQIRVGLAGMSGNYDTIIRVVDSVPPRHCRLSGKVSGKTGVIKGNANINLREAEKACLFLYQAEGIITGALATFNPRYIEGIVQTLLKMGISKLASKLVA
jgi:carbon monoxide dehydrogenase subunit G